MLWNKLPILYCWKDRQLGTRLTVLWEKFSATNCNYPWISLDLLGKWSSEASQSQNQKKIGLKIWYPWAEIWKHSVMRILELLLADTLFLELLLVFWKLFVYVENNAVVLGMLNRLSWAELIGRSERDWPIVISGLIQHVEEWRFGGYRWKQIGKSEIPKRNPC